MDNRVNQGFMRHLAVGPRKPVAVMFDGQFGSTGKGLLANFLSNYAGNHFDVVTTNQGPNSGHTAYTDSGKKVVLKQLPMVPVMWAYNKARSVTPTAVINAGAVVNPEILKREATDHNVYVVLSPDAAVVTPELIGDFNSDIASTGQGVGPAMIRKMTRTPESVVGGLDFDWGPNIRIASYDLTNQKTLVEVAQGWSLGINTGFYPYVTSRECSVAQGLADAGLAPRHLGYSIVSLRTLPIRVGHTEDGNSGPVYTDQKELAWDDINQTPETTTVTGRIRRVFTWSDMQFEQMLLANRPEMMFINFLNYLAEPTKFVREKIGLYGEIMGEMPLLTLGGYGPKVSDIKIMQGR